MLFGTENLRGSRISRHTVTFLILSLGITSLGFGPPSIVESDSGRLPIYQAQLPIISKSRPPGAVGTAELIMDFETGEIVFQRNGNRRLAPASLTKIMTAIVALERGELSGKVRIKKEHLRIGSTMGLWPGDVVTLEGLLWGLLLPSGNDAAVAIADQVGGGSVDRFVVMMNDKAFELGLWNTRFANPHGLDEEGHYSTAVDLAKLTTYALRNQIFAKMVATARHQVIASRTFSLVNANQLLSGQNPISGIDGVKTGITDEAGDCLIATVTRGGHRIIVVAMGTPSRVPAAARLINFAFDNYCWIQLKPPPVLRFADDNGVSKTLTLQQRTYEMRPKWQKYYIYPSVHLYDSFRAGSEAGIVSYREGDKTIAESPLLIE